VSPNLLDLQQSGDGGRQLIDRHFVFVLDHVTPDEQY
jgi:hypothetical protein